MYTVGEFSRIAQVSKRLLRYYDQIDLLKPDHSDPATGYRYYSAGQMTELNRILALKELGLSLDRIRRMLNEGVSTEEMTGMLMLKKAEIEQQLVAERQRIRLIESRLQAIRNTETGRPLNVVLKRMAAQPILSTRLVVDRFESGLEIFRQIRVALPASSGYGPCICMCHNDDYVDRDLILEMGCLIEAHSHAIVPLNGGLRLGYQVLPAVETMATSVVEGARDTIHTDYQ